MWVQAPPFTPNFMRELNTDGVFLLEVKVRDLAVKATLCQSKTEADRMLKAGAFEIRHERDTEPEPITDGKVFVPLNEHFFMRCGKRWISPIIPATVPQMFVEDLPD